MYSVPAAYNKAPNRPFVLFGWCVEPRRKQHIYDLRASAMKRGMHCTTTIYAAVIATEGLHTGEEAAHIECVRATERESLEQGRAERCRMEVSEQEV